MVLFYCWDVVEGPKDTGEVYLMGQIYSPQDKEFTKCCIIAKTERQVFVVPLPKMLDAYGQVTNIDVTFDNVQDEISRFLRSLSISEFQTKWVEKENPFYPDFQSNKYIEVRYSANYPLIGFMSHFRPQTFSKIIGTHKHVREIFLLDTKIKGPCWLDVQNLNPWDDVQRTTCAKEFSCDNIRNLKIIDHNDSSVSLPPPPPLIALTVHVRCLPGQHEISMISLGVKEKFQVDQALQDPLFDKQICMLSPLKKVPYPEDLYKVIVEEMDETKCQVLKLANETALLKQFARKVGEIDPDLVIGHDLENFQINVLVLRFSALNIQEFRLCSRIRFLPTNYSVNRKLFLGRLTCDTKFFAKELLDSSTYSFDLKHVKQVVLQEPPPKCDIDDKPAEFVYSSGAHFVKMISLNTAETEAVFRISDKLHILPLAMELAHITGCTMNRCLVSGPAEKVENLLLNAFSEQNCIVPDWQFRYQNSACENVLHGGLVLNAKPGLYENYVVLLDFRSLYPSIMREFNICFQSVIDPSKSGVIPKVVGDLVENRQRVKDLLAFLPSEDEFARIRLDTKQKALKMIANSVYGCLGFPSNRFYAKHLAGLIARKGREILKETKDIVEAMGHEIIYGDTDSLMINTKSCDINQANGIGEQIKTVINEKYKFIRLDIDKIFKCVLVANKKNYAALIETKNDLGESVLKSSFKGLEINRHDRCLYVREAAKTILSKLFTITMPLSDRLKAIYEYLDKIQFDLKKSKLPVDMLVMQNELKKEIFEYKQTTAPFLQVAFRYAKAYNIEFRRGDIIPFVICSDGSEKPFSQRAYHVQELKAKLVDNLDGDQDFYLFHEVVPVLTRLCQNIPNFDMGTFDKFIKVPLAKTPIKEKNKYAFYFTCIQCGHENSMTEPRNPFDQWALEKCINCPASPYTYIGTIAQLVEEEVRKCVTKVFGGEFTAAHCPSFKCQRWAKGMFNNSVKACEFGHECPLMKQQTKLTHLITDLFRLQDILNIDGINQEINTILGRSYDDIFILMEKHIDRWADVFLHRNTDNSKILPMETMEMLNNPLYARMMAWKLR